MGTYITVKLPTSPIELAASKDLTRPTLCDPSYTPRSGKWFASDTQILSMWQGEISNAINSEGEGVLVPAEAVREIRKQYGKATPFIMIEENCSSVKCPRTGRTWRIVEGNVPNFERANTHPREGKQTVKLAINPQHLLRLAKSLNEGAFKKNQPIKLEFDFDPETGEVMTPISAIDNRSGRQGTIMPCKY